MIRVSDIMDKEIINVKNDILKIGCDTIIVNIGSEKIGIDEMKI